MAVRAPADSLVVLAASSGGLKALSTVLAGLPAEWPAAIAIVLHRTNEPPSNLAAVLARRSNMHVKDAVDGHTLNASTAYVARPDLHLTITPSRTFQYVDGHRQRHVLSSANPLLESAAEVYGPRLIAVVLTGYGADGTDGVQAVRARGGVVIAQHPYGAEAPGMPMAAMRTGAVSFVLDVNDIAPMLVRLVAGLPSAEHSGGTAA